jgi:hypothetical protein
MLTQNQLIRLLKQQAREAGSQKILAIKWGISQQNLSDVIKGRTIPGPKILKMLGYESVVMFKKIYRSNAGYGGSE